MKSIDPLQLQRLIDGESSISEIQQLVKFAGEDSRHWRTIALALLEERACQGAWLEIDSGGSVSGGMAERFDLGDSSTTASAGALEKKSPASGSSSRTDSGSCDETTFRGPKVDSTRDRWRAGVWPWLAVATALAVATLIGYRWGQTGSFDSLASSEPGSYGLKSPASEAGMTATGDSRITPVTHRPDYHLELSDVAGGRLQGSIPLYSLDSFERQKAGDSADAPPFSLSPQRLSDLQRQGIWVQEKLEFISGDLENGKKFLIPVRSIHFSPGY